MRTLVIILMCSLLLPLSAQNFGNDSKKTTLKVTITDIKKIKGHLLIAVFSDESKFLKKIDTGKRKEVTNKEAVFIFEDLPYGTYAVSIFQDINGNNSLDTNFLGIPNEPYGFSNNPSTFFGPPSFNKASFTINSLTKSITIKL